ncbi:large conductance mechanosensitive channel protein MscL [Nakamurella silvestris]|nr:large conductance mechanosensitive channel protein MscL [Nakamurella silvestris]
MLKGLKDFILRGNVVELAIAVVIGGAFALVISAFTDNIISPILAAIGGSDELGFGFRIIGDNPATFVNIGALLSGIIAFVITASVIYFVFVVPMNHLAERRKRGVEPAPTVPSETDLLIEIRDLLAAKKL